MKERKSMKISVIKEECNINNNNIINVIIINNINNNVANRKCIYN